MDNTIKECIKDNQIITGLYKYFHKLYQQLNDTDKELFKITFKEKLKRKLENMIYQKKLNLEIPIIKDFFATFTKLHNPVDTKRRLYQHLLLQFQRNGNNIINTIANGIVDDEPAKIFFNIVDVTTKKEMETIIRVAELFYKKYQQNMNQKLDLLTLPTILKNKKINYQNLRQKELPSLQQFCNQIIQNQTNIICFPYLELTKNLKIIGLQINIEKINAIDLQNQPLVGNSLTTKLKL